MRPCSSIQWRSQASAQRSRSRRLGLSARCVPPQFSASLPDQTHSGVPMHVWIDQDLCTGDGLCTDHCPELFVLLEDGISYMIDPAGRAMSDPPAGRRAPCACPRSSSGRRSTPRWTAPVSASSSRPGRSGSVRRSEPSALRAGIDPRTPAHRRRPRGRRTSCW